jgi:dynein heavy chain
MLRQQQLIVPVKMTRYQNGLTRLGETNLMVDELKNKLVKLMPEIQEKTKNTVQMVEDLEIQSKDAAEIEKTTAVEEAASKKIYNEVMAIKSDCELILGEAMPALNKALAALDTLDKKDIVEMKMYSTPPEDLVLVLNAVCTLLGETPSWDQAKKLMNNPA